MQSKHEDVAYLAAATLYGIIHSIRMGLLKRPRHDAILQQNYSPEFKDNMKNKPNQSIKKKSPEAKARMTVVM